MLRSPTACCCECIPTASSSPLAAFITSLLLYLASAAGYTRSNTALEHVEMLNPNSNKPNCNPMRPLTLTLTLTLTLDPCLKEARAPWHAGLGHNVCECLVCLE